MNLEMILEEISGHSVIVPVMTLADLEKVLDSEFQGGWPGLSIDVNIAGERIFPLCP